MISLASFRFRNVLACHGGPVARIDAGEFPLRGRRMIQANAWLRPGLVQKGPRAIYSSADGTGAHRTPAVARHMAVSEAMERWAYHVVVRSERAGLYGFDVDPSSNGMAAFPGFFRRSARRKAVLEAVERFCLLCWWEGRMEGTLIATDWPGVSAVLIDGPFGGVTAIVFARTEWGAYVYGHAAEESIGAACERALVELVRHERVMRAWWLRQQSGEALAPANLFERRCVFFAGEEGHGSFRARLEGKRGAAAPSPAVVCDREIAGPWAAYAAVWRFVLRPPSPAFLAASERFFFW